MKYSYNWLKELLPKLPKPEKIVELLTLHAFEVESVEVLGKDTVLDIAVLPNRIGDAGGHVGMAREIAAIVAVPFSLPRVQVKTKKAPLLKQFLSITVSDKNHCRRYVGSMVVNVKVKESPPWLRERLEVCGLRSINNIVDVANYVMLLTGQPMHAFDYDKLAGTKKKTIIVRTAHEGERITTLDGIDFSLRQDMLVIADDEAPLAIAGIKGGKKAEITDDTARIVLEAAVFDGPSIRRASQALGLRTDSSTRFSVGLSASLAKDAMAYACAFIEQVAGGVILSGVTDIYQKKEKAVPISLRLSYMNSLLGTTCAEKEVKIILTRLGCKVANGGKNMLCVTPPLFRRDLTIEEDLIEEVGRIHGLAAIEEQHPLSELIPPEPNDSWQLQERMRDMFRGGGFQEVYNYSFVGKEDISAMRDKTDDYMQLENPARPEFSFMRASLGPGLLQAVSRNLKHEDAVHLFEIGNVFKKDSGGHREYAHVAGIMADSVRSREPIFFELKGALSLFFEHMGIDAWFDPLRVDDATRGEAGDIPSPGGYVLHPHRSVLIKVGEEKIGVMGEVHPRVLAAYGVEGHAALFEIHADVLGKLVQKEMEFRPISRYPSVMRDIALLVPLDTRMAEVEDVIENTGGELLVDTDLVDMYVGSELPDGKKNFAFRLMFQSPDRTLTDDEVNEIVEKITKTFEETNPEWETR